jgi:hypothetical protein
MPSYNAVSVVELKCVYCGKFFTVIGSKLEKYESRKGATRRYCSTGCYNEGRKINVPTFICSYCGVTKKRRRFVDATGKEFGFDYTQKFCSKECGYKGRRKPPSRAKGYLIHDGYRAVKLPGGKRVLEHRLIMEKVLGRSLFADENVHHKDGDRANNDPSNLELWSTSQPCGQRVVDKVNWAKEIVQRYDNGFSAEQLALGALSMAGV